MDLSSRRAKKPIYPGCIFQNGGENFLEAKIQNGCRGNDLFNRLTYNDEQYMVSDLIFVKEYIFLVYIMI